MEIIVNGTPTHTEETTLAALLAAQQIPTAGTAVAVDGRIVRQDAWESTTLHEGATIMLIRATQGG